MQSNSRFKAINRRQVLSYLGVSVVVAAPTLTYASKTFNARQPADESQAAQSVKKIVVSF